MQACRSLQPGSPDDTFDSWRCLEAGAGEGQKILLQEGQAFAASAQQLARDTALKLEKRNREAAVKLELKAKAAVAMLKDPSKTIAESQVGTSALRPFQVRAPACAACCRILNWRHSGAQAAVKAAAMEALHESIKQMEASVRQGRVAAEAAAQVPPLFSVLLRFRPWARPNNYPRPLNVSLLLETQLFGLRAPTPTLSADNDSLSRAQHA